MIEEKKEKKRVIQLGLGSYPTTTIIPRTLLVEEGLLENRKIGKSGNPDFDRPAAI